MPMPTTVEVVADLTMCANCAIITANGIDDHSDDDRAHLLLMHLTTADWSGHIVLGEQTHDFSARRCDTCDTTVAGARYDGVLLSSASASTVASAGVMHGPALPTYDEVTGGVIDWGVTHTIGHAIQRLRNNVLMCHTCDDGTGSTYLSALRITRPEPTGMAASFSPFD